MPRNLYTQACKRETGSPENRTAISRLRQFHNSGCPMLRRAFLQNSIALSLARSANLVASPTNYLGQTLRPRTNPEQDFDFVFFTDTHLQPELGAVAACAKCFHQINEAKPEFCVSGGDQVFDVCEQDLNRARMLFKLYRHTEAELACKVYHTVGNHDVIGLNQKSPIEPGDPVYGKKLYEDNFGKLYYSFDYKGWHLIVLDSIGIEYYKSSPRTLTERS